MVADPLGRWVLTVAFLLLAVCSATGIAAERSDARRVLLHLLHVTMAVDMAGMVWPWWSAVPTWPRVMFFGAGAVWLLLSVARRSRGGEQGLVRSLYWAGQDAWRPIGHAVMLLAMVWMVLVIGAAGDGAGIPADRTSVPGHAHQMSVWPSVPIGIAVTAALIVTGTILSVEFVDVLRARPTVRGMHVGKSAAAVVMSFGMAAMCCLMVVA